MKLKFLFPAIVLLFTPVMLFAADWAAVVNDYGPAVARITVSDDKGGVISRGTGFVIETDSGVQRLVTNAHVVAGAEHNANLGMIAEFLFPEDGGQSCRLSIESIDREQDLCILSFEGRAPAVIQPAEGSGPSLMEEILIIGYPLGKNFKTTPGYIQAYQDIEGSGRMLDLSATAAPGNSGGPVLNSRGELVGIVTSIIPGYNFNLAIPASNLLSLMAAGDNKLEIRIESNPPEAWVFLDGDYKGKTPLTQELYNREYKLVLEKEGFQNFKETIGPWTGSTAGVSAELSVVVNEDPVIEITAVPAGADISINNESLGKSPVSVQFPAGSILRIRLAAPGYREKLEFYEVGSGKNQKFNIELEKKFLLW